ncbi:MAG: molybdopterin molybdotransferase MoeA [Gammaproteobacteria bacterium]|nr:molybdopterin molybdotransferase MoeA [Gammaproteobacteria bacterium]
MASGCDSATVLKPIEETLEHLLSQAKPVTEIEWLATEAALGRVLAEDQLAAVSVPAWDNSAMDGYALRYADLQAGKPLTVAQRIPAGAVGTFLESGTAARIFTGAPVPEGADTVVMQEHCQRDDDLLTLAHEVAKGANIRRIGEDVRQGEVILNQGVKLSPQHLGLAASVGLAKMPVYRRLKVAILCTGDELIPPGEPLGAGQIHDSNRYTFIGLLQALGCEVIDLGRVADDFVATQEALSEAAAKADLVLASGGVSVGEEDHVKAAVESLGALSLWRVAIRPGKPLAFGFVGETPFIGVPGNPVSLFVTVAILARPFILRCQGRDAVLPNSFSVRSGFDWSRPDKRREYMRVRLYSEQGQLTAEAHPSRSSGVLSSVTWSDGLAILPEGKAHKKGDLLEFIPFSELLN